MADGSENDESAKLKSVNEEDVDRSEVTPLSILSNMGEEEEEEYDDEDEEEYEEDEDEEEDEEDEEEEEEKVNDGEKAMVVVNNEELNADKVEDETKTENAGKEDANKGKDEEKPKEPKTAEDLGEKLQKKRSRPRNRNRRTDAQKESVSLAANGDKPESSSKNNDTQKSSVTLPANGDKPESSNKKKGPKRVESMGMVFMCTSKTKTDCFRYKILGLPGNKKDQVAKIYKGMRLFLFDVDLRLMYGIFKAVGPGGFNLEPKAFDTDFPSQVRFTVMEDCLPLAEEKFKGVLKENYYSRNKFEGLLKAEQVRKLCKLFVEMGRAGGSRPKAAIKSRRTRRVVNQRIRGDESHRSRVDDGPRSSRPLEKRKRPLQPREEERPRPHSPPRREKRRYTDYERERERERERPVLYERERERERERPVVYERERERERERPPVVYERERERERPVSYERERERERPISYERERERERPILYEREREPVPRYLAPLPPPSAVSPVRLYAYERQPLDIPPYVRDRIPDHQAYRIVDERERDPYYSREAPTYREPVYTLPPEYHIVGREYHPPALHTQPEYRLSSGSRLPSYRDELPPTDYRSSAPTMPEYHPRTHYRY